jgi:hypothetical protein
MWKKTLPLLLAPLVLAGCQATFTNLSALQQPRTPTHLYPVEVAFNSKQQALRWDSIKAYAAVDNELYPLRQTRLMQNRWEGLIPVPNGTNAVIFRYKFDYEYNAFGGPEKTSALSVPYRLRILE